MRQHVLLAFMLITTINAVGQTFKLSGSVVDAQSKKPLEYATISFSNGSTGTSSNKEGRFVLVVDGSHRGDSIRLTHVGFETKTISLAQALDLQSNFIFALNPMATAIEEVTVSPQSIPDQLKSAILTTNSQIASTSILDVYYREFAYLDKDLFKFSDAAMHYKITSTDKKPKVETFVAESRVIKDSVSADEKWKSDVESLIDTDKSAKEFSNLNYLLKFVGKNHENYFDYSRNYENGVIKIHVVPKASVKKYLPSTVVFIDEGTNRIHRVDYGYDSHLKYMPAINLLVLKYAVKKDWVTNIYDTGNQAFLRFSKVTQDIDFKIGKKSGLLSSDVEVLITNVNSEEDALKDLSKYKNSSILKNGNNYKTSFWEESISIIPTAEELKTIDF